LTFDLPHPYLQLVCWPPSTLPRAAPSTRWPGPSSGSSSASREKKKKWSPRQSKSPTFRWIKKPSYVLLAKLSPLQAVPGCGLKVRVARLEGLEGAVREGKDFRAFLQMKNSPLPGYGEQAKQTKYSKVTDCKVPSLNAKERSEKIFMVHLFPSLSPAGCPFRLCATRRWIRRQPERRPRGSYAGRISSRESTPRPSTYAYHAFHDEDAGLL